MASENLRFIVMEMLLTENVYSHMVVRDVLGKYNYLPSQEKSFIKRLYEGTVERRIELDYVIDKFSKIKTQKMKPVILAIMRMSTYQILYMDAVPDSAACNEAVKLAKKKGFGGLSGFVNGVLRNIARNKDTLEFDSLAIKYSMPQWIVDMWVEQIGEEKTKKVLEGLLEEHPVTIRIRNKKLKPEIQNVIEAQGGSLMCCDRPPYAYKITKTDDVTRLPGYDKGGFVIQDASSMLAVEALHVRNTFKDYDKNTTIKVLDICAAPGGKSMLLADIFNVEGIDNYEIISRDISGYKVSLMEENFNRCGLDKVKAQLWDALEPDESLLGNADIVIADVPCSGLGVIGKKRDIKYNITKESIKDIIKLQENIVSVAVKYLKPKGRLLYSTCTINKNENEDHVLWIKEQFGLKLVESMQLLPGVDDCDGFFISVFER